MILEISCDDGNKLDFKLIDLLLKYKLPGTFYIPTYSQYTDMTTNDIKYIDKLGFTVAGHTSTHPKDLKLLSPQDQYFEIKDNKDYLEKLIGKEVNSFCYPSGRYNEITIEQVKKAGYKEARTTIQGSIEIPKDKYRIKTSIHIYPETKKYNKPDFLKEGIRLFNKAKKNNNYYHIFCHSWEIDKFHIWDRFEQLLKYINKNYEQ